MATKKTTTTKKTKSSEASANKEALKWSVLDMAGKEVGTVELNAEVFGIEPNRAMVHDTVRWQLAKRRAGTHQALTRSMMKGGGKKPFKQKGTGRARAGSNISPLWVGGASVHGPLPRSYEFALPKRTRRQALASVLSDKVIGQELIVIDHLTIKDGKTKAMVAVLEKIGVKNDSAVFVSATKEDSVCRASGNLPKVISLDSSAANVYDLLRHKFLVCTKDAVKALETRVLND